MIAQIALTDARHALDKTFDYLLPENLEGKARAGMRVLVPFGYHSSAVEGLIVGLCETSDFPRLKSIKKLIDSEPICSPAMLSLCFWMRETYLCTFYQAFKLVIPPKLTTTVQEWAILLEESATGNTPAQEKILAFLRERDGIAEYQELKEALKLRNLKQSLCILRDQGKLALRETIRDGITFRKVRKAQLRLPREDAYAEADLLFAKGAHIQASMLLLLCEEGPLTTADLVSLSNGSYSALTALEDKGLIEIRTERVERAAYDETRYTPTAAYTPTEEQKPVIAYLKQLIETQTHETLLLRGVTGSGKTEVFLQAIDTCIQKGRQAIMLVPEISLTPQMVERFVGRFGRHVAVMHSGLSYGERFDQWNKIKHGEVSVVVGARSAVFAPFENIGIIILDEEHETSYKSEIAPRYHARDIAAKRAQESGAPLLLASATPSVTSYYKALSGEYRLFEMHRRYNQIAMPETTIVDMRSELFDLHNLSVISTRLAAEIQHNLDTGEKTILFLNRRGYNTFVSCRACGHVLECPQCSIAMTYHRSTDSLVCHYCGKTQPNVKACPVCGSPHIKYFGTGTQKIESELYRLFPGVRVLRMDFDTTSGKGGHEAILTRFKNGEADILLGTQMVTKGLDFHEVTLVGVLAADTALNIDDFRANERSFSLITQVCGRAGRGEIAGRAVIQTYQPQNATIAFAKAHDYLGFYENEIRYRKRMLYPPFSDIILLLVSGEDETEVKAEIGGIGRLFSDQAQKDRSILHMLGPGPAPILKVKNKYRYRLLIKAADAASQLPLLRYINQVHMDKERGTTLVIDVNPNNMN